MAGEETAEVVADDKKRKVESTPPDGYVCRLCSTPGHWIQVCPTKKTGAKRQRKSDHVPVPGQDPSPDDIERAKELQKIPPPNCKSFGLCACAIIRCSPSFATSVSSFFRITGFCGIPSRLNKVKRSKEGGDNSRAVGTYFFFCIASSSCKISLKTYSLTDREKSKTDHLLIKSITVYCFLINALSYTTN